MNKLVVLRISCQSSNGQYQVIAEIGNERKASDLEVTGWLPKLSNSFLQALKDWKLAFRNLDTPRRLKVKKLSIDKSVIGDSKNLLYSDLDEPRISWNEICGELAEKLNIEMNSWLSFGGFQKIIDKLSQELSPEDNIQIIVCTNEEVIYNLPWNCWSILKNLKKSEVCFSLADESCSASSRQENRLEGLKILVALGDDEGIDLERDKWILGDQLSGKTDIFTKLLVQPSKAELETALETGTWDLLFFSGHSETFKNEGVLYLKGGNPIYLSKLEFSFKRAISNGLKLAIFNSCDGVGIARTLQKLQIPQIIVMREPIPDKVAHDFLTSYIESLQSLDSGSPLYLAERYARESVKSSMTCADWLPVVFQNHKVASPVRGFIEKSSFSMSNDKIPSLHASIGIVPELQFEERIYGSKKSYKVTVIDPISENSIGKIQYRGGYGKPKYFP
ncbi:hypothetical protein IQ254_10530 [Nodosilinea sp. LEGE 07088]|uniref:CHAT domain-containing protein n=1 Tax=Nodosilinea sp. LEGE 07088 TaxID=2777968 RepID=UPI001882D74F|nr:CHAT domain-containing protein [Nodosilinea sp. LEGE 07088]MBE9137645.1 hypothetical protein [Nodosilinea sp. LEGE 07088]